MTAINSNRAIRGPVTAVPVVAGKGVRLVADAENNRWVVEADETVLWENANGVELQNGITLSESRLNFESIKITYIVGTDGCPAVMEIPMLGLNRGASFIQMLLGSFDNHAITTAGFCLVWQLFFAECTATYLKSAGCQYIGKTGFINGATPGSWTQGANNAVPIVFKVVGINRVSGGN